jgi:hypothetical protein
MSSRRRSTKTSPQRAAPAAKRDTRLEAAGAEFLVLGLLLAEGIHAWKAYTNFPGWDVVAADPANGRTCRIQVKSRWATGAPGFPMGNFECDFVCYVALNRGFSRPRKSGDDGRRAPEVYVLPLNVVRRAWVDEGSWQKVYLSRIDIDAYFERWDLIQDFLRKPRRTRRTASRASGR